LIELIKNDKYFEAIWPDLDGLLVPKNFIGRAPQQVEKFLKDFVQPAIHEVNEEIKAMGGVPIENAARIDLSV
jgi:adenylosuccinate lyase